jgi:hypothetical protein
MNLNKEALAKEAAFWKNIRKMLVQNTGKAGHQVCATIAPGVKGNGPG